MTEEEKKAIRRFNWVNHLIKKFGIEVALDSSDSKHLETLLNLIEKLKKENQELRNTKNNCPQFNTSGIKCKNKDIHCPTSKETLDYYENFLIPGYEEEIKKLKKENEQLNNRDTSRLSEIGRLRSKNSHLENEIKYYYIPKDEIEKIKNKNIGQYMNFYREIEELLKEE